MLELKNIYKSYQMTQEGLVVLRDVSLTIQTGEFVAIMGPSGSGKSTLLNIIGLLDVPDSGSYKIFGTEVIALNDDDLAILRREVFGFVFQQFNLLPRMNAVENVELPLIYSKGRLNLRSAKKLLEKVGLAERLTHKPKQLSGGQQQRVAVARALINNPRIILADEPTGNLDSSSGREILTILRELNEQGITVILVTHEEAIAKQTRRVIRVHDGMILSDERFHAEPKITMKEKNIELFKNVPSAFNFTEFVEHFKEGFKTLLANKVRTGLSILGILIGVSAVITMLALGNGAKEAIEKEMASLGSNMIVLRPGNMRYAGRSTGENSSVIRLGIDDADNLQKKIPYIKEASPVTNGRVQVTFLDKNWNTQVIGSGPSYARMHVSFPESGRFFTEQENKTRTRVAVLGLTVVKQLFGDKNPIGEYIKLNKVTFQVIGILPEKGATSFRDQDDVIMVPVNTAMFRLLGKSHVDYIDMEINNPEEIEIAQELVKETIIKQYNIPISQQRDAFEIRNMADIQSAMTQTSKIMSMLLSSIAAVSLLVGGIGIMNIMLVSVTERIKEIGLRKAVGARRRDILIQFLTEAGVIGIFGGLLGVLLGLFAALIMSVLANWTVSISLSSVIVSFSFSVVIGIVFGIWPAKKASIMNPIDALRRE